MGMMDRLADIMGYEKRSSQDPSWAALSPGVGYSSTVSARTAENLSTVLACVNAFFSNGQYSWMPVWLPELYPTRMRATALAFVFNGPRFIAFLGPLLAGAMIVQFGGYGQAAMALALVYVIGIAATPFLPETVGKPVPP